MQLGPGRVRRRGDAAEHRSRVDGLAFRHRDACREVAVLGEAAVFVEHQNRVGAASQQPLAAALPKAVDHPGHHAPARRLHLRADGQDPVEGVPARAMVAARTADSLVEDARDPRLEGQQVASALGVARAGLGEGEERAAQRLAEKVAQLGIGGVRPETTRQLHPEAGPVEVARVDTGGLDRLLEALAVEARRAARLRPGRRAAPAAPRLPAPPTACRPGRRARAAFPGPPRRGRLPGAPEGRDLRESSWLRDANDTRGPDHSG